MANTGHTPDIARAVRFLTCAEAQYVTGTALLVDGGACSCGGFGAGKRAEAAKKAGILYKENACFTFCQRVSSHVGMLGAAPLRPTTIAAARAARRSASCSSRPLASAARKKPQNVSPAAVVSTACTGSAG